LVVAAAPAAAKHDQSDVATMDDGSTYHGEIKSVQYATLNLNTGPAGLLGIEWRHVTSLTSKYTYRIELDGGTRHFGTLGPSKQPRRLNIVSSSGSVEVDFDDVVNIVPFEHGLWKRLAGSVNFGLTYTQANEAFQYNLSGNANYRSRKHLATLSGQSIFSTQQDAATTNQHYLKLELSQVLEKKWGAFELAQLQSNPDQGYDLRFIVGGGATRFLVESSRDLLALSVGPVSNWEDVVGSANSDHSAEILVDLSFRRFRHGSHSPSIQLNLGTFTNVTETPRFRSVLNFIVGWNIVGNFTFDFQINNNYDSDPPGVDSEHNDLNVVTSIGYSF
jgi:hypothetical protein